MALGPNSVCVEKAFILRLTADGQKDVEGVLDLLQEELILIAFFIWPFANSLGVLTSTIIELSADWIF